MIFPLGFNLKFDIPRKLPSHELLEWLEGTLLVEKFDRIALKDQHTLEFKPSVLTYFGRSGGLQRKVFNLGSSTHSFKMLDRVEIHLEESGPDYQVRVTASYLKMFLYSTALVFGLMGYPMLQMWRVMGSGRWALLGFMWLWLCGGNYLFAYFGLKKWLKNKLPLAGTDSPGAAIPTLKPFDPGWQPEFLRKSPWKVKALFAAALPILIFLGMGSWRITNPWTGGPAGDVFPSWYFGLFFWLGPVVWIFAAYSLGTALDRWNEAVQRKNGHIRGRNP